MRSAVSDVYQDLFGEGSYTGKGIYDVDAFEAALAGRVPDITLLSHDLFEGMFARAGLVSDVEVVEEFPSRYDVAAVRQHRWARGDWQLLPWILGPRSATGGCGSPDRSIPAIGRWKMLDNLRRSLSAPAAVLALLAGWTLAARRPRSSGPLSCSRRSCCRPCFPSSPASCRASAGITLRSHLRALGGDVRLALAQIGAPGRVPRASGVADERCDRAHAVPPVRQPPAPARMGHGGAGDDRAAARSRRLLSARWPARWSSALSRCSSRWLSGHADAWLLAAAVRRAWIASPAIARWASLSPRVAGRLPVSDADARALAADRAPHLALLRDLRHGGGPHAAAGQLPGRSEAGRSRIAPRRPISASICCRWSARATSAGSAPSRPSSGWRRRSRR